MKREAKLNRCQGELNQSQELSLTQEMSLEYVQIRQMPLEMSKLNNNPDLVMCQVLQIELNTHQEMHPGQDQQHSLLLGAKPPQYSPSL